MEQLGARVLACDSAEPGYAADLALDGDPATFWHTAYSPQPAPLPHWLVVDLGKTVAVHGLRLTPRADMANGRIARAEIRVFDDPDQRGEVIGVFVGEDAAAARKVFLDPPARGRYVDCG